MRKAVDPNDDGVVPFLLADTELAKLIRGAPRALRDGEHDDLVEAELQIRAQRAVIRARLELRRVGLERALAVNPGLCAGDRVWDEWSVLDAALRADAAAASDLDVVSAVGSVAAVAEKDAAREGSGSGAEAEPAAPVDAASARLLAQLERCANAAETLGATALLDARYVPPPLEIHGKAMRPGDALGVLAKEALVRAAAVERSVGALRAVVDRSVVRARSGTHEYDAVGADARATLAEAEKMEGVTAELNAYAEELERSCNYESY